ncbi:porin family protein [Myroides pelagicus]|uniref:Outer membrane beta-barrel protein n=1 Tax=Myroides pelagicus TaxID=270914 RepID=A0A7K1GN36_9FLAO|nr:porin family protein [Myroides pelagicus]MEC4113960.1 porin family protein [Myroides pelagicus]MTH30228.1 outer membrane beta-barrel protein [Myroides pelagicus]
MKTRKSFALAALFTLGSLFTYAQSPSPFHVGLKAGANFTDMSTSLKDYNSKTATGFALGAMARFDIKKSYLQAEMLYSEKNVDFTNTQGTTTTKMKNIEVPVVFGHKIIKSPLFNLRAFAGGVYTSMVGDNFDKHDIDNTFKNFDKSNIGYRVGAGIDVLQFTLDVSYDGGFNNVSKDFKTKPNTWLVSVGFFFL